jgi:hypothetical protein
MREELDDLKLALSQIAPRGEELRSQDMRRLQADGKADDQRNP